MNIVVYDFNDTATCSAKKELLKLYPHDLTFFENRPDGIFNLKEIEEFTEQRLQVMMIIKEATDLGFEYMSEDWNKHIFDMLTTHHLQDYIRLFYHADFKTSLDDIERRRRDFLSHYMLVLACCSNETKRNYLIRLEADMFHVKFNNLPDAGVREFIRINNVRMLKLISNDEKSKYRDDLLNCTDRLTTSNFDSTDFYKVPYTSAPELIQNLDCFVRRGFVYVPHYLSVYVFKNIFIGYLTNRLLYYCDNLKHFFEPRLQEIIDRTRYSSNKMISDDSNYVTKTTVDNSKKILESFDTVAQTSFPLCSRNLVDVMQRFHHLKYNGRQLLQLFLKGIGLTVHDCLTLFRNEFTKIMTEDHFQKEYGYYIEYNYGLKGSKINVPPPNCMDIIENYPPANHNRREFHGCPFKEWDIPCLERRLAHCGISNEEITQISNLTKEGHAQVACSKFFEYTHGGTEIHISHPNQFYKESRKYFTKTEKVTEEQKSINV
ncbi:DNA primase large subunit-like [Chrysoperla carnea]|uniref:DNA primase large subunit-like n=1 Tax=Chrysoperla carnea TaxID=189513 RepID=UPI001D07685F|nr:DNA primase large subunit-like [Chrysoperla carnea]